MPSLAKLLTKPIHLREWIVVAVLAILVGLTAVVPLYALEYALGSSYQGMPALVTDSEGEYLSYNHELAEGRFSFGTPVFYEYKNWPALIPVTGNWLYEIPTALTGMQPVAVDMLYKFLLPALLFVLLFILFTDVTASFFWASIGALLLGSGLDFAYAGFLHIIFTGSFPSAYFSSWTRPVNPVTGMLGLIAYLICLYRLFTHKTHSFVLPGILIGLIVSYFFSFVYAGLFALVLAGASWWRDGSPRVALRVLGVLAVGAAFVALLVGPTALAILSGHAVGMNDPQLQGLFYTHLPFWNKTSLFAALLFVFGTWLVARRWKEQLWHEPWWLFCAALLVTNQLVYNIQVVLGWTIWPQHFAGFTNMAIIVVIITMIARVSLVHAPKVSRILGWLVIALLVLALARTLPTYRLDIPTFLRFQTYQPAMAWLTTHTGSACVVFVGQDDTPGLDLNRFIAAYTNCDVYNSYHIYEGVPRTRVFDNVMASLWLKGITPQELPKFLDDNEFYIRSYFFQNWAELFPGQDEWTSRFETKAQWETRYVQIKEQVTRGYTGFLAGDVHAELARYRLDYIVVDRTSRVRDDLATYPWLTQVYAQGAYRIYAFKP